MAFVPVPDVARVEVVMQQEGQIVENVFHVYDPAGWSTATLTALALDAKNKWNTTIRTLQCAACSTIKILCRDLTDETAPGIEYSTGMPLTGGAANPGMPMNVTVAVKWLTGLRGRSYRGRTYHVGLPAAQCSLSTVVPASLATILNDYDQWRTFPQGINQQMVVVSTRHDKVARPVGVWTAITGVFIDGTLDSQRRRLPGRGR